MDLIYFGLDAFWQLPSYIQVSSVILALFASLLVFTRVYTTLRYRTALASYIAALKGFSKTAPLQPPSIPYSIPVLGNALSFLAPKPGEFWKSLLDYHPASAGSCTLLLGGRVAHILHNPASVQALFRSRETSRREFNVTIVRTSLGLLDDDVQRYHGLNTKGQRLHFANEEDDPEHVQEKLNLTHLLNGECANELTREFVRCIRDQVDALPDDYEGDMYKLVQAIMFEASGRALMGEKVFEYYPDFGVDFCDFDKTMLSLFLGIPEVFLPDAVKHRERSIAGLMRFHAVMKNAGLDGIINPADSLSWEPNYGSRVNRARQEMYNKIGLSTRGRAGLDLGFLFGLASNAIPTTGWMLMHILDPNADNTLYLRVRRELKTTRLADGRLDINILTSLPLLQSVFHEVLRLYTDLLVTRSMNADITLPLDASNTHHITLKQGTLAIAPSWLGHRDPTVWNSPPHDVFYAERFLTTNPETGEDIFTTSGTAGRFFPFGGGKGMCPGRVFAKQEVLAATAMVLLEFDVEFDSFVDEKGEDTENFPGLREGFGGSGIVVPSGDAKVRMRRKKR